MTRVIFATGNSDKMREIREIFGGPGREILSMREAGFSGEIVENGSSFKENAEIKAKAVWRALGGLVLADDSGFVVDCLGGEPGIYSARWMEGHPYSEKNRVLIERTNRAIAENPSLDRRARFICNICAVLPDGRVLHAEAPYEGEVALEPAGSNGFGYDPILWLPQYKKTSAELTEEEKNAVSHRGRALRLMRDMLVREGALQ
jgi:XTP/dITP diphosphohydrolase